jgi:site-specific DNA-methyltransferase (adenine-specific)
MPNRAKRRTGTNGIECDPFPAPLDGDWIETSAEQVPVPGETVRRGGSHVAFARAETLYDTWPSPVCIVSDGPYGISGFPGDEVRAGTLAEWYRPHVEAWSRRATGQTTLWFWCTEVGWASVHPVLEVSGWDYRCCNVWDKGMGHVAGNVNTRTLRKYPVVTEVCAHYVKAVRFPAGGRQMSMQEWLRHEWVRSGLPLGKTNEACGVRNAATRKYFTECHLWYYPPVEMFERLRDYANRHGELGGRPYFSIDGRRPLSGEEWARLRAKFTCEVGISNVWRAPQVAGRERIRGERTAMRRKFASLHGSQKPLDFIDRTIRACTDEGDVVWEPFGGLCPAAVASLQSKRICYSAEVVPEFYRAATRRLAACRAGRLSSPRPAGR